MPSFTRNEKILLRSSERKDLLVEKYIEEINNLYTEDGEGRRTRQSSNSSMVHSVFEKDRNRERRKDIGEEVERGLPRDTHWYETKVEFQGIKVPIRIPMTTFAEDVGEVSQSFQFLSFHIEQGMWNYGLISVLDRRTCSDIFNIDTVSTAISPSSPYEWSQHTSCNLNP